ncbi:topoisomerase DNA-binding C4 zinc finger domain-containing protein [uncultured Treponema sp.]|uniref:topoisomerase DNA-binding C4 zinc finger domain-containing protein n=1 Tax=uncultured Treponema sp. TaxID=162155 RepID=UPI0035A59290
MNGYHKNAAVKTPTNNVDYNTVHKGIQRTGNKEHLFIGCTNYPYCEYTEQIQKE